MDGKWYTRGDAARASGASESTIVNWVGQGKIVPTYTVGGLMLFSQAAVDELTRLYADTPRARRMRQQHEHAA